VVGWLKSGSPTEFEFFFTEFRRGLGELGFVEGRNVRIEYRWATGRYDNLPELALTLLPTMSL
jgi:putative ABC transport system substrate-binding protein